MGSLHSHCVSMIRKSILLLKPLSFRKHIKPQSGPAISVSNAEVVKQEESLLYLSNYSGFLPRAKRLQTSACFF